MIKSTFVFKSNKPTRFFFAIILFLLGISISSFGQTTLAAWNFPNNPDNATCDQAIAINSAKTISLVNANTSPVNTIDFSRGGTTTNCASSHRWDDGVGTKCFIFNNIVTTGYKSITFSAIMKGNSVNCPRNFMIQYKYNNGTWIDINSFNLTTTYSSIATNLSLPNAVNQTDVDIRIIQTSNRSINSRNENAGTDVNDWVEIDDIEIKGILIVPIITTTPTSLSGFSYVLGNGPSTIKSFNVTGSNLVADILITPPANYEISLSAGSGFTLTPIMLPNIGGNVSSTTIYIRLKYNLPIGNYNESVNLTSSSADTKTVSLTGGVINMPVIKTSTTSLSGFIYKEGDTVFPEQTVTVSGVFLLGNILVTAPANYEIGTSTGSYGATITLPQNIAGTINETILYVRLKGGLAVGSYNLQDIVFTSTGAVNKNITCGGAVVSTPTILGSPAVINGFSYMLSAGPSLLQTFTVSGASLTAGITVTPTTEYEISVNPAGPFITASITIAQTDGKVNPTLIFIRLKKDLIAAPYSNKIIYLTSEGATKESITCNGLVYIQPTILAGVTEPVCNAINLTSTETGIVSRYWTGPLGFYTTLQNPSINPASASNNGSYIVKGDAIVDLNLVTNGDFEAGNTGFSSSYGYVAPVTNALTPEGKYTIVTTPNLVHNDFSSEPDHTDPGTLQMVINGYVTAGVFVWRQTVNIIPNTFYRFTYWEQSVHPTNPSVLQLYVNGVAAGPVYTADAATNIWKEFVYNWYSGNNTVAELSLINQNTVAAGNDFALDDIVFQQVIPVESAIDVVVYPTLTPAVSIAASVSPLYSEVSVTFTATPVNGGSTPTYQWKINGINIDGANSSTYTYNTVLTDQITCEMTSNYPCTTISTVTSNTLTVSSLPNFWIGTVNTDWSDPNNWTALKIPLDGDDVIFATLTNNSGKAAINDLFLDTDRTIGNLINETDKKIVIPTGKSLKVNNTITTDGNPDRILIQSKVDAINGSLIFLQPKLNSSVQATVEMYSKAFYNPGGLSNNKYKWQFFGIPVSEVTASPTFNGSYVRWYDETGTSISNHWLPLTDTSILTPLTGYEITQEFGKTITFKGQLVNTDLTRTLAFTIIAPPADPAIYPGQHVFGNPYTAAININQLEFGAQTIASVFLYNTGTYDDWTTNIGQTSDGTKPGQYSVVPKNYVGIPSIPSQIPSMQGFLVKAISFSPDATFKIPYSSVIEENTGPQLTPGAKKGSSSAKVYTIIDVKGARYSDRMWIFSEPVCTRGFDNGWDGEKFLGSAVAPQLYAMEAAGDYQIDAVDDINGTELGFLTGEDSIYTLTFTQENLETRYPAVYLLDLETNSTTEITQSGTIYPFTAQPGSSPVKRFRIVTNIDVSAGIQPTDNKQAGLQIFSSQQTIFVHNFSADNGFLYLYDLSGRFIQKLPFTRMGISTFPTNLVPGSYIAKAISGKMEVNEQVIIK